MIIESLLDNDYYQFTMSQYAYETRRDTEVFYKFVNRSHERVVVGNYINLAELQAEIAELLLLRFNAGELNDLGQLGPLRPKFLAELATAIHKDGFIKELRVRKNDYGEIEVFYRGPWFTAVLLETPILAIITELFCREYPAFIDAKKDQEWQRNNIKNIGFDTVHNNITFSDFGTRRRYSRTWHEYVIETLKDYPSFAGTSNVLLASKYGVKTIGTMAHQLFMVEAAKELSKGNLNPVVDGSKNVLSNWRDVYYLYPELQVFLPDTFGTKYFLRNMPLEMLNWATGFRQDSGDPFMEGALIEAAIKGILKDNNQRLVFSDSLNMELMIRLNNHFGKIIPTSFGYGTHLTNDMGILIPSIVIKPVMMKSNPDSEIWWPCVKLSDNTAKAIGDATAIRFYRKLVEKGD